MRIHISLEPELEIKFKEKYDDLKPKGLWYGIDNAWIDWCKSEEYLDTEIYHKYEVLVNENNILRIGNQLELEEFEKKYGFYIPKFLEDFPHKDIVRQINWEKVQKDYGGIEINPYRRLLVCSVWYSAWDCSSGCVWESGFLGIRRLLS